MADVIGVSREFAEDVQILNVSIALTNTELDAMRSNELTAYTLFPELVADRVRKFLAENEVA